MGAMTLARQAFCIMALYIITLRIMKLCIMTSIIDNLLEGLAL